MTAPGMAALRAHAAVVLGAVVDATGRQGTLTIEPAGAVIEHPACGRVSLLVGVDTLLRPKRKLVRPN